VRGRIAFEPLSVLVSQAPRVTRRTHAQGSGAHAARHGHRSAPGSLEVSGSVIPSHRYGAVPYRGYGNVDYACGKCDRLHAIGARRGMFESVLIACGCGALNEVPLDSARGSFTA
jgi:hypothetical protein